MVRGVEDLRTRIGEVLRVGLQGSHEDGFDTEEVLALADAVVRELGLTRVTRSQNPPIHRYVTDWTADE